ncbi:MAG: hypothetical protein HRU09_15485 [Oligoflexales bacterium]|nr:hypothetical protein [Oligoflexales bacterium]
MVSKFFIIAHVLLFISCDASTSFFGQNNNKSDKPAVSGEPGEESIDNPGSEANPSGGDSTGESPGVPDTPADSDTNGSDGSPSDGDATVDNDSEGSPDCPGAAIAGSSLLTESLSRELTPKEIRYEIYALDCYGAPIKAAHVSFDFLYTTGSFESISYDVFKAGSDEMVLNGTLEMINDADIFGTLESGLSHFKTDKPLDFSVAEKLIVSFDVSSVAFLEPIGQNKYEELPTFLKIESFDPIQENLLLLEKDCIAEEVSRIKALSEQLSVTLDIENSLLLEYELYSTDCLGNDITANEIRFDLNYQFNLRKNPDNPLFYSIINEANGEIVSSGSMVLINGNDLFGNTGNTFYYYKTDTDINFPSEWEKLKLQITWQDAILLGTTEGNDMGLLPSYIKFGDELEPAKKDIILNIMQ